MTPAVITDPRQLVRNASIEELVVAYSTGTRHPFALLIIDGAVRFICPRCGTVGINGGTAEVTTVFRWSCSSCRHDGTRFELERHVLEHAAALEALLDRAVNP